MGRGNYGEEKYAVPSRGVLHRVGCGFRLGFLGVAVAPPPRKSNPPSTTTLSLCLYRWTIEGLVGGGGGGRRAGSMVKESIHYISTVL